MVRPGNSNILLSVGVISNGAGYRSSRVFRSTNQGNAWTSVLTTDGDGTRVAFAPSSANRCFVATSSGRLYRNNNGGVAGLVGWHEPYTAANQPTTQVITALAVGWNDPNLVYIGCGGYSGARALRSTDGGATWIDVSGATGADRLPNLPVNSLVIDQYNPDVVYVANDIGVFRTQDGGNAWQNFSEGFLTFDVPRILVTELALRRSTNTLYASTMGRGAYRRAL